MISEVPLVNLHAFSPGLFRMREELRAICTLMYNFTQQICIKYGPVPGIRGATVSQPDVSLLFGTCWVVRRTAE